MVYPFRKIKNLEEAAYKLKVLAVANGMSVIDMTKKLVDSAYEKLSSEHRALAEKVVQKEGDDI